jgi:hypothetical protein
VFQTTGVWEAFTPSEDPVPLAIGQLFTMGECLDSMCNVSVGGLDLWAEEGSWVGTLLPAPPSDEVGWWVPVAREGVAGWVRGEGFVVEVRCVGPDEGADLRQAEWH